MLNAKDLTGNKVTAVLAYKDRQGCPLNLIFPLASYQIIYNEVHS